MKRILVIPFFIIIIFNACKDDDGYTYTQSISNWTTHDVMFFVYSEDRLLDYYFLNDTINRNSSYFDLTINDFPSDCDFKPFNVDFIDSIKIIFDRNKEINFYPDGDSLNNPMYSKAYYLLSGRTLYNYDINEDLYEKADSIRCCCY